MYTTVQRPNQVGTNTAALLQTQYDATLQQAYDAKARLFRYGIPSKKTANGGSDSFTWVRRGKPTLGPAYKAIGATIQTNTIPKSTVSVNYDARMFDSVPVDMDEKELISRYSERAGDVQAMTENFVEKYETRLPIVISRACFGASTATHLGGINYRKQATSLSGAYAFSATGATAVYDDLGALKYLMERRKERMGSKRLYVLHPYLERVLMKEPTLISRDFSSGGDYSMDRLPMLHGIQYVTCEWLPSTNVTGDLADYNGNFDATNTANDGSSGLSAGVFGQPAAFLLAFDDAMSPVGEVTPDGSAIKVWDEMDGRRYIDAVYAGQRYGLGVLDANCAAGIFVKSTWTASSTPV